MAIPFRTNVDLRQNQILRRVIEKLASAPGSPVVGQEYYNTVDNNVYVWNGTSWMNTTASAGEANTASNVGTGGVGVFKQKTGSDLEFRNIAPASARVNVTLDAVNNEVEVDVVEASLNIANMSGVLPVSKGGSGTISLTGLLKGNGTSAFSAATAGTDYLVPVSAPVNGHILTVNGAGVPQDSGKAFNDAGTTSNDVWSAAQIANAINNAFASQDAMIYKGTIDCSTNPNYPAADAGWTYKVSVSGRIGGAAGAVVEAGDLLICNVDGTVAGDHATVGGSWSVIQTNIDGAVTGPASAQNDHLAVFNGTSGKTIKNSTVSVSGNDLISVGNVFKNTNQQLVAGYRAVIGNTSATSFTITHNLNSLAAVVKIYETATGVETIGDVTRVDANSVQVAFATAPGTNELEVVVLA